MRKPNKALCSLLLAMVLLFSSFPMAFSASDTPTEPESTTDETGTTQDSSGTEDTTSTEETTQGETGTEQDPTEGSSEEATEDTTATPTDPTEGSSISGIMALASVPGSTYNINTAPVVIDTNGTYKIIGDGTPTTNTIKVDSGVNADITLDGVNIDVGGTDGACAFDMTGATVELTLDGTNTLKSGSGRAGLEIPSGATISIGGTGSLEANSGEDGAGIGGGVDQDSGNITVDNGTITAISRMIGAGIGGGGEGNGTIITINGGNIFAKGGGDGGAGIGGGDAYSSADEGNSGTITINGGTIEAIGQDGGAGIGGGRKGNAESITINDGVKIVAVSESDAMAIGNGREETSIGTLSIDSSYVHNWWSNTSNTDPGGAGTHSSVAPFDFGTAYRYARIEASDGDTPPDPPLPPDPPNPPDPPEDPTEKPTRPRPDNDNDHDDDNDDDYTPPRRPVRKDHFGITNYISDTTIRTAIRNADGDLAKTRAHYDEGHMLIKPTTLMEMFGYEYIHDTHEGTVQIRVRIPDPERVKYTVYLCGAVYGREVDRYADLFRKYYLNDLRVVDLHQNDAWGQTVKLSALVDFDGMDTDNLYFYSYNKETHEYHRIETNYTFDRNGYIHFSSDLGGAIIISDGKLRKEGEAIDDYEAPPKTGGDEVYTPATETSLQYPADNANPSTGAFQSLNSMANPATQLPSLDGGFPSLSDEDKQIYIILLAFFALAVILPIIEIEVSGRKKKKALAALAGQAPQTRPAQQIVRSSVANRTGQHPATRPAQKSTSRSITPTSINKPKR